MSPRWIDAVRQRLMQPSRTQRMQAVGNAVPMVGYSRHVNVLNASGSSFFYTM
jgi:hypothetical protein